LLKLVLSRLRVVVVDVDVGDAIVLNDDVGLKPLGVVLLKNYDIFRD
jgi:hypothetical protein